MTKEFLIAGDRKFMRQAMEKMQKEVARKMTKAISDAFVSSTITVTYNETTDTTRVAQSPAFVGMTNLQKCDCIRDAIYELEKLYNATVKKGVVAGNHKKRPL